MKANEIAELLWQSESETLDFKCDQYPFDGVSDELRSELLKDILAFSNAWRLVPAHILIGVEEVKHGRSIPVGTNHLVNRTLQTFVNSKTNRPITFAYEAFDIEGKSVGVIEIPVQDGPLYLNKKFGRLEPNTIYIRRGDTTTTADPDEIAQMGAKREEARNQPLLSFCLGDLKERHKYRNPVQIDSLCFLVPDTKRIPLYGNNNSFGLTLKTQNEDYYADVALYLRDVPHLSAFAIVITNESRITAQRVVVRLSIKDPEIEVLAPRERRAKPARDPFMKPALSLLERTTVWVERGTTERIVKIEIGDIQPGTEEWSMQSFFIGTRTSRAFSIAVSISANNLGQPVNLDQSFEYTVSTHSLSVNEIIKWENSSEWSELL